MLLIFHPQKTEYEIETKETMQREQKVIVLRTMAYCNVLCGDKRLLNWFSDARKRHFKVVISQNFPCGAGRGKPPPPPSPSPALSLRRRRSSFFDLGARPQNSLFFKKNSYFSTDHSIWPFLANVGPRRILYLSTQIFPGHEIFRDCS